MKNVRSAVAASAVALALVPFFAGAISVADLQAQIQTLLAQIAALQQQMNTLVPVATTSVINIPSVAGVSGTVSVPPASSSGVTCPVFNFTFSRGSKGDAVMALQKFLVSKGFLTSDSVTGFFGPLTESAVRNFQAAQGIASSGTASSTGWGVVGQTTSAAIIKVCSAAFATQPAPSTLVNPAACTAISLVCPAGEYDQVGANCSHTCVSGTATSSSVSFSALPMSGQAPLIVTFTSNQGGASYVGGVQINFGDGSSAMLCNAGMNCGVQSVNHTYSSVGSYAVTLVGNGSGGNSTLGTAMITVN